MPSMQGGSAVELAHAAALPILHMQTLAVCKAKFLAWRAFRGAAVSSTFYPWRTLLRTTSSTLSAPVWTAPIGLEVQLGQASHVEAWGKEGAIEYKISKDDEEILQKAIACEAERGFPNTVGRTKRFSEFLASKLLTLLYANSSHSNKGLTLLFYMAQSYENMDVDNRVVMLDKVCALLGFKSVQDLVDHHHALNEASKDLSTRPLECSNKYNANQLLQKNSHPAIVFGSSERIELFNFSDKHIGPDGKLSLAFCEVGCKDDADVSVQPHSIGSVTKRKGSLSMGTERAALSQVRKAKKTVKKVTASDRYEDWMLNKPISLMEGLTPTMCSQLEDNGFYTLRKLLQHYPRNYLNFLQAGQTIEDGQFLRFSGKIVSSRTYSTQGLGILEVLIETIGHQIESRNEENNSVTLHVKKFFSGARYSSKWFLGKMVEKYPVGAHAAVSGKVKALQYNNHYEVKDYNLELVTSGKHDNKAANLYPIYPAKGRLDAKFFKLCIQKVLPNLPLNIDPLPEHYKAALNLMDLHEAYIGIHSPDTEAVAEKARQRFVFDEFLFLQLGLLLQRQELTSNSDNLVTEMEGLEAKPEPGYLPVEKWAPLTSKMLDCLPFKLTDSQLKSVSEIIWDLQRPVPMRRLLQGDVGCGKTIVAFLALLEVIDAGLQGVLMGPTEFLAKQHFEQFVALLEHLDETSRPKVALLTSSVPPIKARAIRLALRTGDIQLAVGTHSLLSESVNFSSLGLAVIDEQHRFGVEQRLRLHNKGSSILTGEGTNVQEAAGKKRSPHVLAMTATPIPRTLAFALYGDMDLSQIDELPSGRKPVKTFAMFGNKEGLSSTFEMVREKLASGGRAFIVYAIIDESDSIPHLASATAGYERIVQEFNDYRCGLVHGKLKPHERDAAMNAFKSGQIQVLVATAIVEVGIDIVEASMMVVMNAERFGMAQLHQLRGRVGRGTRESTCVLLTSSQSALDRIKLLESSYDGFRLAELDLQLRGPGDMLGKKQSGHLPEFSLACLSRDGELMTQARNAAQDMLQKYPGLEGLPGLKQELSFRQDPDSVGA
ncbi:hypothetical protein GOP47_0022504 [Adiantum capillus-veneris]|uniref:DNA helicase n=1 Tax=Adiantum capillus-veneris TaxID=13818 RepID=A0A9D4U6F3_ADICA|nr:hypothetical protein GOP47_0022504 [Adiantum capillus-veneris]